MSAHNAPTQPITKARRAKSADTNRMPCVHGGQGRTNEEASENGKRFLIVTLSIIGTAVAFAFVRLFSKG